MIDIPADVRKYFVETGREGGKAAAKRMSKQERVERAKKAVQAREAKRKKRK